MGLGPYNGWAGRVRDVRGAAHSAARKKGIIPPPHKCEICGLGAGHGLTNTYHAEEYGSTWEDYLLACHALCPYHHGFMHVRARHPNRFMRMKARLAEGDVGSPQTFKTLNHFFTVSRRLADIEEQEDVPSGIAWLDAISVPLYTGPEKIATLLHPSHGEIPDPKIYGTSWESMKGHVLRATGELLAVEWEWTHDLDDLLDQPQSDLFA